MIDHHSALIYVMVLVSAADADMTDAELETIGENVRYLPVFQDFSIERLPDITRDCTRLLTDSNGLDKALDLIRDSVPDKLCETAYAVACDIAAADAKATQEELRMLELLRHKLGVDRLCAAAIERGARARHMRL
ncbi:tellurite resistance protein [Azospirillum fermentarium]|uniref:tellurite resistance TerB family protein n=1 Tax=Azospirillum fermentarium TaxID=1233114 RepID=UPI0022277948|nr:tellurite resistance TerB family protein [Azospirillum fermentarium]MCW2245696.1 tellurite resistance protein [Azospirillum fermentarium]